MMVDWVSVAIAALGGLTALWMKNKSPTTPPGSPVSPVANQHPILAAFVALAQHLTAPPVPPTVTPPANAPASAALLDAMIAMLQQIKAQAVPAPPVEVPPATPK